MRQNAGFREERPAKRQKLQQSITNMFGRIGPKFVEVVGVQLLCPYCHRKAQAPPGLVAHKHMHERNGHTIPKQRKLKIRNPLMLVPPSRTTSPKKTKKLVEADPQMSLGLKMSWKGIKYNVSARFLITLIASEKNNL